MNTIHISKNLILGPWKCNILGSWLRPILHHSPASTSDQDSEEIFVAINWYYNINPIPAIYFKDSKLKALFLSQHSNLPNADVAKRNIDQFLWKLKNLSAFW